MNACEHQAFAKAYAVIPLEASLASSVLLIQFMIFQQCSAPQNERKFSS
jgi:hypothetical protein